MTPKEKAKELVDAMGISTLYLTNYTGGDDIPVYTNQYAKHCAFIAVNEMLNNAGFIWGRSGARDEYRKYWQDVKAEIEKM